MIREGAQVENFGQNQIRRHRVGDQVVEMIRQTLPGDCVLINYLNTESLVNGEGRIVMSPRELRNEIIAARQSNNEDSSDILEDNQPLSYKDTIRLFSTIYNVSPKQEDVVLVGADRLSSDDLRNNIEHGVLEYLDTYPSGLCTTGMGYHSRTIWKLGNDNYIVIDPMNPNGFEKHNKISLVEFLTNLCANQRAEHNFFFFIRENEEG